MGTLSGSSPEQLPGDGSMLQTGEDLNLHFLRPHCPGFELPLKLSLQPPPPSPHGQ